MGYVESAEQIRLLFQMFNPLIEKFGVIGPEGFANVPTAAKWQKTQFLRVGVKIGCRMLPSPAVQNGIKRANSVLVFGCAKSG